MHVRADQPHWADDVPNEPSWRAIPADWLAAADAGAGCLVAAQRRGRKRRQLAECRAGAVVVRPERTGTMGSKQDEYWEQALTRARDLLGVAASAGPARVVVPDLRDLGAGGPGARSGSPAQRQERQSRVAAGGCR